ncbi:MAG: hypothetical protein HYT27_02420 [Parcubacteria group bacterium]|nr:hypothetical protein [Parcubacteria group bacterium]
MKQKEYIALFIFAFLIIFVFIQSISQKKLVNGVLVSRDTMILFGEITLPIKWDNLGAQMIEAGVIDEEKLESVYGYRGGIDENMKKILYGEHNGKVKINEQNAGFLLNMLWGLGLANKNPVLEEGPMMKYGGDAGRFASTAGWILSRDNAMEHYGKHSFIVLTQKQQALVEEVSKNIYRPCCGNSTYFPDCNHGMAMLGLLELMASQGVSEEKMYETALQVNSYWFPDTYSRPSGGGSCGV